MAPEGAPLCQCVCSTAKFVRFNSHGRNIGKKLRGVILAVILLLALLLGIVQDFTKVTEVRKYNKRKRRLALVSSLKKKPME